MKTQNINSKKKLTEYVDVDYTLTHVPLHARKNWVSIFVVLLGFTFLATSMAAGANIGVAFKMDELIQILIIGSLILALYVGFLCWISAKTGLNSILLARYALGKIGSKWGDIILGGTQVFWYAVQSAYIGTVFTQAFGLEKYYIPITVFFSLFFGVFAIKGTRGMEIIAYASMPAFIYLAYIIPSLSIESAGGIQELFLIEPKATATMTFSAAVTITVGTFISGGTNAPNWARFAKTPKTGFIAGFLSFFVGTIVMVFSGMLGGIALQQGDMVEILISMGIVIMGVIILIFNIWTTNTATAYSFGVAGAEFFNKPNKIPYVFWGLIIATIMAAVGIYEVFIPFLSMLGIFIPPLGGLIIADYFYTWRKSFPKLENVKFRTVRYANLTAYLLATLGAYISSIFEVGFPSINGVFLVIVFVFVLNKTFEKLGISDLHEIVDEPEIKKPENDNKTGISI
ncbi:cytosine permease [Virgibacillus byunsanensis]|uniref:Cytosine permease n=1 Tax=Virgibacillus byunsanensis TaxID=570945 RepID=A0ABW3LNM7_9BACI